MQNLNVETYKSIIAPRSLKASVIERATAKHKKRNVIYRYVIIAACFVLIVSAAIPLYIKTTDPEISVASYTQPSLASSYTRAVDGPEIKALVTLELKRETTITVNHGYLQIYNSENAEAKESIIADDNIILELTFPNYNEKNNDYVLTLNDIIGKKNYYLSYNKNNDSWSIKN